MEEIWKPIVGFSGYLASNQGNVISNRRAGTPRKLETKGIGRMYNLISEIGERRYISRNRIVYAFLHEINPDSINGYIIGSLDKLQLVSKEEFYAYTYQKMTNSKKVTEEEIQQFYDESLQDILLIRQFHQTGDITSVAEAIYQKKEVIVDYIMKIRGYSRISAYDIWSVVQEKLLLGIYKRKIAVLNIRTYLARMIRNEVGRKTKENSRTVYYEDRKLYKGIGV